MTIKLGVVMDPISQVNVKKDSSKLRNVVMKFIIWK